MNRRSKILLGATTAALTVGVLHFTLGERYGRFYRHRFGSDCGRFERWNKTERQQPERLGAPDSERPFSDQ